MNGMRNLLIIGNSETSVLFMKNLVNLVEHIHLTHVFKIQAAMDHLLTEKVPLIVLDNDTEGLVPQSISKIIRLNYPAARIIVISQSYSNSMLLNLINLGHINAFLPIPTTDDIAYSLIIEQDAQNQIYEMLNTLVREPPEFSPAYFLKYDETIELRNVMLPFRLLGSIISHKSVVKHVFIEESMGIKNDILTSLYFAAINSVSDQLFEEDKDLERLDFGNIALLFKFYGELEFTFIISDLSNTNTKFAEQFMHNTCVEIANTVDEILIENRAITEEIDEKISSIIKKNNLAIYPIKDQENLKFEKLKFGILKSNHNHLTPQIIEFIEGDEMLSSLVIVKNQEHMSDLAKKQLIDIVIINLQEGDKLIDLNWIYYLKEISPRVLILGFLVNLGIPELSKIIETNLIDSIFSQQDNFEETKETIRRVHQRVIIIRTNVMTPRPQNLRFAYEQTSITKSIFRLHPMVYSTMQIPSLLGILILRDGEPFYSELWADANEKILSENETMVRFISSLIHFNSELFNSQHMISTLKFESLFLVVLNYFELSFIFFTRKIDDTNVFLVYEHITHTTLRLYEILAGANIREAWSYDFEENVKQHITELFLKFSSISLTVNP